MQISFDPGDISPAEAGVLLVLVLRTVVRGCRKEGTTRTDFSADMAKLVSATWDAIDAEEKGA